MEKVMDFIRREHPLRIAILSYEDKEINIVHMEDTYYRENRALLLTEKERKDGKSLSKQDFHNRLYEYLWNEKISELIIVLFLENKRKISPTIYDLNRYLRRTPLQYSSTFKEVSKLASLGILRVESIKGSKRRERSVSLNNEVVEVYGDDEFRTLMLENWDDARIYTRFKRDHLEKERNKFENTLKIIRKGKRPRKNE